ncbi:MAG: bL17 family ribosomal protein [Clostridiales bacterium]|jgi:large subunit ribosomal protein L17|nr:bL17 family ribosomal protein [Clostridiales bacterium]
MNQRKLGKPTDQRKALLRNQVTALLWNGKIETTFDRAKEVSRLADKLLTMAVKSYTDTVKKVETRIKHEKVKDKKGVVTETEREVKVEIVNDGPKKLAARRRIMATVYDVQEQRKQKETAAAFRGRTEHIRHPLIEKIFNEYAPRYARRAADVGTGGGYTRVLKMGFRRGDAAEKALIELV